jgi:hypothetical protein
MSPALQLVRSNSSHDAHPISFFFAADNIILGVPFRGGLQFFYYNNRKMCMKGRQSVVVRGLRIGVGPERR